MLLNKEQKVSIKDLIAGIQQSSINEIYVLEGIGSKNVNSLTTRLRTLLKGDQDASIILVRHK